MDSSGDSSESSAAARLIHQLDGQSSEPLRRQLQDARGKTDALFSLLTSDALYSRAIAERHRLVFYIGHLEAFDWNLLGQRLCAQPSLHAQFEQLFAFGIDPIDGKDPCDVPADWPDLDAVFAYQKRAREAVDALLDACAESTALPMAIEHRLMHLETLSYMLPHLPLASFTQDALRREHAQPGPSSPDYARTGAPHDVRIIDIPQGDALLGKRRADGFGWDNEFDAHVVSVPRFSVDARNVTNGEFLAFVRAGGYSDPSLWRDEDWHWLQARGLKQPMLWTKAEGAAVGAAEYLLRTAFAQIPLPLDWPASVSLAEARAYIRHLNRQPGREGARLLREAEYHRAAYGVPDDPTRNRQFPWGDAAPQPLLHGNFGCARYDFSPVGAFPAGDSAFAVADLMGNGWEWTETPFQGFHGFAIDPLYPGYSQPFFDDKHFVIKGASARTDTMFLRRSFRNWFQSHYPYVFATFRCAYDAPTCRK